MAFLCSRNPNTYWQERGKAVHRNPREFHAALAKDGWLGLALAKALGGSGLGISGATLVMQTIAESPAGKVRAHGIHANILATQLLATAGISR